MHTDTIVITIRTEGSAFDDNPSIEVARILAQLAIDISVLPVSSDTQFPLKDINGNTVGNLTIN